MSGAGPITEALAAPVPVKITMPPAASLADWGLGIETRIGDHIALVCDRPGCSATLAAGRISALGPRRRGEPPALRFRIADLLALTEAHEPDCPTREACRHPAAAVPDFADTFPVDAFRPYGGR